MNLKHIIDCLMTLLLMLLMSLQVTGQKAHEYIGISMFVLVLVHQFLNRRWYASLLKGRYNANRLLMTAVNISLLVSFMAAMFSGIIMSENFPSLNIDSLAFTARLTHLSSTYASFVLMGLHLGLHWGMIAGRLKSMWLAISGYIFALYGLYAFVQADIFSYIFLTNQFAFIDYDKEALLVFIDNAAMLSFWVCIGYNINRLIRRFS